MKIKLLKDTPWHKAGYVYDIGFGFDSNNARTRSQLV